MVGKGSGHLRRGRRCSSRSELHLGLLSPLAPTSGRTDKRTPGAAVKPVAAAAVGQAERSNLASAAFEPGNAQIRRPRRRIRPSPTRIWPSPRHGRCRLGRCSTPPQWLRRGEGEEGGGEGEEGVRGSRGGRRICSPWKGVRRRRQRGGRGRGGVGDGKRRGGEWVAECGREGVYGAVDARRKINLIESKIRVQDCCVVTGHI